MLCRTQMQLPVMTYAGSAGGWPSTVLAADAVALEAPPARDRRRPKEGWAGHPAILGGPLRGPAPLTAMLFNTYVFIFGFVPLTLAGYFLIARASLWAAASWVGAASLVFYGWWNPKYVLLLLASIAVNFAVGRAIARSREAGRMRHAKTLLVAGLAFDLSLLAFYKYANFFAENLNAAGAGLTLPDIVLPLGISFYTFTQIAFLVDAYRGIAREYSPVHYLLFVTYFPRQTRRRSCAASIPRSAPSPRERRGSRGAPRPPGSGTSPHWPCGRSR
jgi:hypothetical protein